MKIKHWICVVLILLNHLSHSPLAESSVNQNDQQANKTSQATNHTEKSPATLLDSPIGNNTSQQVPKLNENEVKNQEKLLEIKELLLETNEPQETSPELTETEEKRSKSENILDIDFISKQAVQVAEEKDNPSDESLTVAVTEKDSLENKQESSDEPSKVAPQLEATREVDVETSTEDHVRQEQQPDTVSVKELTQERIEDDSKTGAPIQVETATNNDQSDNEQTDDNKQPVNDETENLNVAKADETLDETKSPEAEGKGENQSSENLGEVHEEKVKDAKDEKLDLLETENLDAAVGDNKTSGENENVETKVDSSEDKHEHVKLEVDSIKSFEEWKKQQIQDREEAAAIDPNSLNQRTIRTKKTQVNYASQDCGAKILAQNSESKHVSAILDENKDMYMLNPCSANIWFVVELCEPIQVRQLQLANLELFSSAPKLFDVYISERYPAREWHLLGTFEARNERSVQTFAPNQNDIMFAKYIKFEMKSHFGNEHFCPLTLVRVLGVSMVEEYEETEEKENKKPVASDTDPLTAGELKSEGLTDSEETEGGSIGKMLNIVKSAVDNLLGNGPSTNDNATRTNQTEQGASGNESQDDDVIDPNWESPVTLVTNRSEVERSKGRSDSPLVTLVQAGDGQEIVLVDGSRFDPPLVNLAFLSKFTTRHFSTNLCWFLEFVYRVSLLSCIVQPHHNQTSVSHAFVETLRKPPHNVTTAPPAPKDKPVSPENPSSPLVTKNIPKTVEKTDELTDDPQSLHEHQTDQPDMSENKTESLTDDKVAESDASIRDHVIEPNEPKPVLKITPIPVGLKGADTKKDHKCLPDENKPETKPIEAPHTLDVTSDDVIDIKSPDIQEQPQKIETDSDSPNENAKTLETKDAVTSDGDVTQPSAPDDTPDDVVESVSAKESASQDEGDSSEKDLTDPVKEDNSEKTLDEIKIQPPQEEVTEQFTTPAPTLPPTQEEPATAIPPLDGAEASNRDQQLNTIEEDQVVINPGTNQKESVLMRLSNRIRALEQNMSLSSDYLEDLSQRYRRQMDEMQKAFNRTKTKLADAARKAEESDHKQTDAIHTAHNKTELLREQLNDMTDGFEYLNRQMVARHLCLMAVESVVLIVITVTCFRARLVRLAKRVEHAEKLVKKFHLEHNAMLTNGLIHSNGKVSTKKRKIAVKTISSDRVENLHRSSSLVNKDRSTTLHLQPPSGRNANSSPTFMRRKPLKGVHKKKAGTQCNKNRKMNGTTSKNLYTSSSANGGPPVSGNGYHGNRRGSPSGVLISDMLLSSQQHSASKTAGKKSDSKRLETKVPVYNTPAIAFPSKLTSNVGCRNNHLPWASSPGVLSGKAR
uniref:SUN domain-containing ossification factor-like n=1 Tax=Phallusia mammillata TaxID=59560 RepID=A0A6F9DUJ9_9ASCI|nr:SUN domain-containing ossification factor-like [Phallusia mammillata]